MKPRDAFLILGAMVMPYAIEPLQSHEWFASDICCTESAECPDGLVCKAPASGDECSPETPGYCVVLGE